ncbi:MAG: sulfotransferase [Xanthomonadaceae bacterium]|nr:tetratricopeptide repeat protein [Xanthomonadaceae bacterium]MDE2084512.1 sulfotransferase [Xanthomonadaceae bacterium]
MKSSSRLHGLSPGAAQSIIATAHALQAGRPDDAARALAGALVSHPDHPEALRLEAGIFSLRGQHAQAVAAMRRALAQRPDDALYYNTLGSVLADAGEFDPAIVALRRACELQPNLAAAWYNLGIVMIRCVRYTEATMALRRAVALDPRHAAARAQLADALKVGGQSDAAAAEYRQVIAQQPCAGMAWWGLANIKTLPLTVADVQALQTALRDPRAGDDDRIAMGFALGKAMDDQGRHAESLAALAQANAIARRRRRWDAAGFDAQLAALRDAFASVSGADDTALGGEAIFVVGMPRSGTTLAEQILASHAQVEGAGELPDLTLTLNEESLRRGVAYPQWAGALAPADWSRLGRRYLERTVHWRERKPRFVDKLPNNWIQIGAIRAMLPAARIVVCRRDRLETCFSCYRQHFAGNDWTRDFADLAAHWRAFDRTTRDWAMRYPQRVCFHDYEALVADPETRIRALLDFCGLPFEEACLRFHETSREVRSPSAAQVRQPLRGDTARAAAYGALLDPLRVALGLPLIGGAADAG